MFIDTSAFVALLTAEDDAPRFAAAIGSARTCVTAPHVRLETCMVVATRLNRPLDDVSADFDALMEAAAIKVVPFSDAMAREAVSACARFGKGRGHTAQLNLADCMSYAAARAAGGLILFKGRDFAETDLQAAG